MVIRCLTFGSLWWLRPGNQVSDPLRFSAHAAVFNTTGFVSGGGSAGIGSWQES